MASLKEQFKDWKSFWGEVLAMWRKEHGLTLANFLKASFPIAVLALVVLVYSAITNNDSWQIGSAIALGISGFIAIFNLCFIYPYKKWQKDRTISQRKYDEAVNQLNDELNKLADLKTLKESQLDKEQDWLHFNIEYVDLVKRNYFSENEIYVKYNFVSGLVFDFKPYRMWISPTFDGYDSPEPQKEIIPPDNFLRGKRSQTGSGLIISINDQKLLEILEDVRKAGTQVKKGLKIQMQMRDGEPIQVFKAELS